ncbi:hypothetical protein HC931_08095 [Candidatus Gracilibacteria bacterium]|nr:hypothetical protein [Candidatus Gracilibacteria bacterium]NJM87095.1 hypothetical protein [Hydrococcus sp. RU_2_2]
MSIYINNLSITSPSFARFVASELQPQLLVKKDIVKCLKALEIKNPEILRLQWKKELWIQLQLAAREHPILVKSLPQVTRVQRFQILLK